MSNHNKEAKRDAGHDKNDQGSVKSKKKTYSKKNIKMEPNMSTAKLAVAVEPKAAATKAPTFEDLCNNFKEGVVPARDAPPHLQVGAHIQKYRIEKLIGSGGFGQIYRAVDDKTKNAVAVKVVSADHEPGRMVLEQKVLTLLRRKSEHVPQLIASGATKNYNYIVMEMLGPNLSDLRKKLPHKKFNLTTVLRAGCQSVNGLKDLHEVGYLHRDVKPSNICIGLGINRRRIYIVDYGMTRKFMNDDGSMRPQRVYASFRGTMRYVSLTVHERREQGRVDDFWSLFYSIAELGEGSLPWRTLTDAEEIAERKRACTFTDVCPSFPEPTKRFLEHLEQLTYKELPDYQLLCDCLKQSLPPGFSENARYEWEEHPENTGNSKNTEETD